MIGYGVEEGSNLSCNYLFLKKKPIKNKYKPPVQCYRCIYAERTKDLPSGMIHCTYYPNMISYDDKSCKAGKLGKTNEIK